MVTSTSTLCIFCGEVHEQGDARDGSECGAAPWPQVFTDAPEEEPTRPTIGQLELLG